MTHLITNLYNNIIQLPLGLIHIWRKKEQNDGVDRVPSQWELFKFFSTRLDLNWKFIILINLIKIINSYVLIKISFLMVSIKDAIIEDDKSNLWDYIIEYLIFSTISSFKNFLTQYISQVYSSTIETQIKSQIMEHLLSLDFPFFEEKKVTQLIEIIDDGVCVLRFKLQNNSMIRGFDEFFTTIGKIYFIYTLNAWTTIIIFFVAILFEFWHKHILKKVSEQNKINHKNQQFEEYALEDILNNIFTIKSFGQEQKEIHTLTKIATINNNIKNSFFSYTLLSRYFYQLRGQATFLTAIISLFLLRFSSNKPTNSIIHSITEFSTLSLYFSTLFSIIGSLIFQKPHGLEDISNRQLVDIMNLFNKKPSISQKIDDENIKLKNIDGNISFENVSFKYPFIIDELALMNQQLHKAEEGNEDNNSSHQHHENTEIKPKDRDLVIKDVSFQIKQGQFVSFVGKSGSGKSTITKLIQRLYDPNNGNILFNNVNVKDISIKQIKQSIGYVSQEPTLMDNDILYNITYGCEEGQFTLQDVHNVCNISGVSEFVFDKKRFPDGLKTLIGTNGIKLSGGQKQRVAIARALLKNPSILVLDEATSSLDAESEYTVQKFIDEIIEKQQRSITIIVIAHRLSTILKSDNIFVRIMVKSKNLELIMNSFQKKVFTRNSQIDKFRFEKQEKFSNLKTQGLVGIQHFILI